MFFVEQISNELSPQRNNSPNILNSTELSHTHSAGTPSVSSIASHEPQILTPNDDFHEPTLPYGFGPQLPIIPPSWNGLNLTPNPFNILATMAVMNGQDGYDDNHNQQSTELSEPSPISMPPMKVRTFDSWELSHTTTDDRTFFSSNEPRRIFLLPSSPASPPSPPSKMKRKLEVGMSFPKREECRSMSARPADR